MSKYQTVATLGRSNLIEELEADARRERKIVRRAFKALAATQVQLNLLDALTGYDAPTSLATDARYRQIPFSWERLYEALVQIKAADPRMTLTFQQYTFDQTNLDNRKNDDLKAHKQAIEPQLKRTFDGYVSKFVALRTSGDVTLAVNVIGFTFSGLSDEVAPVARRIVRGKRCFEPVTTLPPNQSLLAFAVAAAEFWTVATDHQPSSEAETIRLTLYRGLLRTDRVCFGHGVGKIVLKKVVAEIVARAATDDALDRSILQPEGVVSFLASLPVDQDGNPPELPPLRLP